MVEEFINNLGDILEESGFGREKRRVFSKCEGAALCIVNVLNADETESGRIGETMIAEQHVDTTKINFRSVIVFNVIVCELITKEIAEIVQFADEVTGQPVHFIPIAVGVAESEIKTNPRQPYKSMGIFGCIMCALGLDAERKINLKKVSGGACVFIVIFLNAVMLALTELNGGSENINTVIWFGALQNDLVLKHGEYYRMVTCMFLHAGIMHFAYNSLTLYIFGVRLEKYMGKIFFAVLYLLSGVAASAAALFFTNFVSVGASGGVFGVIGAVLILAGFSGKNIEGLSFHSILMFAVTGMLMGFMVENTNNAAHAAGFVSGMIMMAIYLWTRPRKAPPSL